MKRWVRLMLAAGMLGLAGCESDEDDSMRRGRRQAPPAGLGSIVLENDSGSHWNVKIDGTHLGRVADESFLVYNAEPGTHLVHLDVHNGREIEDRAVDVEAGVNTIMRIDGNASDYGVTEFTVVP